VNHIIGKTSNDIVVYVDLIRSPAATYVSTQPRLLDIAKRVIAQTAATTATVQIESNLGKHIGYNYVVQTGDSDTIFYAQLQRDPIYSRFVKNGKPLTTQYLSIILKRDDKGEYALDQLWLGRLRPPRPGADNETASSRDFWASHAFVADNQAVQPRTITKDCPY
jgi:hypothetical protein